MDVFRLELSLVDFSDISSSRWRLRRIFIGWMLFTYYTYAFMFFFMVAVPQYNIFDLDSAPVAEQSALQNEATTEPLESETPTTEKKEPAIPALIVMVTFGFIGGVFFITRTFVRTVQEKSDGGIKRTDLPVVWYLTRPAQSALMAIFIYYAFRAGQLVFYSMEGTPSEDQMNVYTLSLLAIIAGAFSEQAFEKLHSIGMNVFSVKK